MNLNSCLLRLRFTKYDRNRLRAKKPHTNCEPAIQQVLEIWDCYVLTIDSHRQLLWWLPPCPAHKREPELIDWNRVICLALSHFVHVYLQGQACLWTLEDISWTKRVFWIRNVDSIFKAAVGNFEERGDLASNLKKYNFHIPPPSSPLHSCPASKVHPPEEADEHFDY